MIRPMQFLFCDNEHGTGDVTFPDIQGNPNAVEQLVIDGVTARSLRAAAKQAGWTRSGGCDYCPHCSATNAEELS